MSKLLLDEPPLQVQASLAVALHSLERALVLQQVHYWLARSGQEREGRQWVYNSLPQWAAQFPWMSQSSTRRVLESLEALGVLEARQFEGFDRTKWYTIDYGRLAEIAGDQRLDAAAAGPSHLPDSSDASAQNEPMELLNLSSSNNEQRLPEIKPSAKAEGPPVVKAAEGGRDRAEGRGPRAKGKSGDGTSPLPEDEVKPYTAAELDVTRACLLVLREKLPDGTVTGFLAHSGLSCTSQRNAEALAAGLHKAQLSAEQLANVIRAWRWATTDRWWAQQILSLSAWTREGAIWTKLLNAWSTEGKRELISQLPWERKVRASAFEPDFGSGDGSSPEGSRAEPPAPLSAGNAADLLGDLPLRKRA